MMGVMEATSFFRAIFALVVVLGLIFGLAAVLRRFGPELMARFASPRAKRRMEVVETLILDPARRLIMVRIDGCERLILLGDGRDLGALAQKPPQSPIDLPKPDEELFD